MDWIDRSDFSPSARRALTTLGRFEPSWALSGRAALFWWLPSVPRPIVQLDLVWHGLDGLGTLPREIRRALAGAGLDVATLGISPQRAWLAACEGKSVCLVSLRAEAVPPLEPPQQARLYGGSFRVETLREVLTAILVTLHDRPDLQDLEDAGLLLRSGVSLERGLRDARCRNSELSPRELAVRLARFEIHDPERSETALLKLRRLQERLVFEIQKQGIPRGLQSTP